VRKQEIPTPALLRSTHYFLPLFVPARGLDDLTLERAVAADCEKLEVYQKAVDFADEAAALTESLPRCYGFLVDQLDRAALSIATNLAEGSCRFTKPDRRNFFTIARGSAQECVPLLELSGVDSYCPRRSTSFWRIACRRSPGCYRA
jgi:four helix bundle protein